MVETISVSMLMILDLRDQDTVKQAVSNPLAHSDLTGGVVVVRQYLCQDSLCSQTLHDQSAGAAARQDLLMVVIM